MKKNIILFLILALAVACSPRKNKPTNRSMQSFYTYYNTLFNSKEALETELNSRDKSHKDNFFAPYINILTYDDQPLGSDIEQNSAFSDSSPSPIHKGGSQNNTGGQQKGATTLEIAENKAMKAITNHSMDFNGTERNKRIFDAHILLAQARIYQNKPLDALDALDYIFKHMSKDKRLNLAKIYQGFAYSKLKDYYRANEIFLALDDKKLRKSYRKLKSIYYAEMLVNANKKEEAVEELAKAYQYNKNKKLRSRIAFLRGQILESLGKNEEARESFVRAYKYSNNFEFEVKSQIEIAKTFNGKSDDYEGAKQYIEKISKKGTYASRKNEFYYALGLMANHADKKEEASDFFHKALKMKVSDPQIRGLTFYEIGKQYFDKDDYLGAGTYYDSALAVMTYAPSKERLTEISANLKKISKNFYLIKKNDSILALTKMSESERIAYFAKYIDKIKEKENKEEIELRKAEHQKGFDTGDYNANSIFSNNSGTFQDFSAATSTTKSFYFANANTVAKGQSDFKRIWGERQLADNWRTSVKTSTLQDLKNEALGNTSAKDPRRLEPSFYIEKIPTGEKEIAGLKKDRDTASLGLGRMYNEYFSNSKLATKTLYDLVDVKPEDDVRLQALYLIFVMNFEKNPADAERAKQIILADFPYTSYAEYVKNPKNSNFTASSTEVIKMYTDAFNLYKDNKFEESKSLIGTALEKYPKDALVPKFTLLNAFNTGKTAGKEVMILQLEQIALNYAKTPEGEKAKEMLKYLKSELQLDLRDENGNKAPNKNQKPEPPKERPRRGIGTPDDAEKDPNSNENLRIRKEALKNSATEQKEKGEK